MINNNRDDKRLVKIFLHFTFFFTIIILSACGSEFGVLKDDIDDILNNEKSDNPFNNQLPMIFWCEYDGTIACITTNKTNFTEIHKSADTPIDICIDSTNETIYWITNTKNIIKTDLEGTTNNLLTSNSQTHGPTALGFDIVSKYIFYNQLKINASQHDIWKASASENIFNPAKLFMNISYAYTYAFAIDTSNNNIYITVNSYYDLISTLGSGNAGAILKGKTNTLNSYVTVQNGNGSVANSAPFKGIAVDSTAGYVYYVFDSGDTVIYRADTDLNSSEQWITGTTGSIEKIAIDSSSRKIYWTSTLDNSIYRADLDEKNSAIERFLSLESKPTGIVVLQ